VSFFSDLMVDAVLPADIRSALSISDAGAVYSGRRFEKIPRGLEVWVERLPTSDVSGDGAQNIHEHSVRLNIRSRSLQTGSQSGADQLATIEGHMETLVERYNGLQPLTALTSCYTIKAEEDGLDLEDDDSKTMHGTVLLSFFVEKP